MYPYTYMYMHVCMCIYGFEELTMCPTHGECLDWQPFLVACAESLILTHFQPQVDCELQELRQVSQSPLGDDPVLNYN